MEPNEIFQLIIKADERVKYATDRLADARKAQARDLLNQARDAAAAISDRALIEQAERRLADLAALEAEADADRDAGRP